jgi:hypothetical protein
MSNELETRVNILRMMYSVVKPLHDNLIYCEQEGEVTIVTVDGKITLKSTVDSIKSVGNFLVSINKGILKIESMIVNKAVQSNIARSLNDVSLLSDDFLVTYWDYAGDKCYRTHEIKKVIFNNNLDIIFKANEYSSFNSYKTQNKIRIRYNGLTAQINELTGKMDFYDVFDLNDKYSCIATEYSKYNGYSINVKAQFDLRYKLAKNGSIISSKAYEDITKPFELSNTNTFYTYDVADKEANIIYDGVRCADRRKGLIRDDGVELLEAIYTKVKYIGADNYLVDYVGADKILYTAIYNSVKGTILNFGEIKAVKQHETLPLTIVERTDGVVEFIRTDNGARFTVESLTSQFKCEYCEENPNILKVDCGYVTKYVTNKLVPITNMQQITKLKTMNWVHI